MNGQPIRVQHADGAFETMAYDNAGRLIRRTDADGVTQLVAYNALGEQSMSAIDMDRDGVIGLSTTDRVTLSDRSVVQVSGGLIAERTITSVLATTGTGTSTIVSTSDQTPNGRQAWSVSSSGTSTSVIVVDGTGGRTETLTRPDGVKSIRVYSEDRLLSETVKDAADVQISQATMVYDEHGRLEQSIDARNGTTDYTYTALDELESVTTAPPAAGQDRLITSYQYDAMGRRTLTILPDATQTTQLYWPTGELKNQSGSQTYPVDYTYDSQGRMKTMSTVGQSGTSVTTWNYNAKRGWLESKRYHDDKGPDYQYTPGGRLAERTWARGIVTDYSYNNAGDLTLTDYSDATPDVVIGHDRLGRRASTVDASGTTTFAYLESTSLVTSSSITGGILDGIVITGTYDGFERRTGFGASHSSVPIVSQGYTYDNASRMATASMGSVSGSYAYHPNSSLINTLTFKSGTSAVATTTRTFDALNRLMEISTVSVNGTTAPVTHEYTVNALSQRTRVDLADGGYWIYGYNSKGEVVSGVRHSAGGTPVPGQSFGYNFDNIGNRNFATVNSGSTSYIANKLNQYTAITGTSGTIAPQHDADGNLTSDGTWTYAWDGENRLVAATSGSTSLSFAYDAQSRRIAKVTSSGTLRFVYDDWNLVAEIDNTNSPIRTHLWGLDLSGSPQGAGGVGGLIATSLSSGGSHFMAFDGNGNVSAAINATDGTHSARFEYDPFGGTLSATGGSASLLPLRFSTKYQDAETGLYYYGYRFYNSVTGRWLNRDPIEESGGAHVYGFVRNQPSMHIDPVGLATLMKSNISELSETGGLVYSCNCGWLDGEHLGLARTHLARILAGMSRYESGTSKSFEDEHPNQLGPLRQRYYARYKFTYSPPLNSAVRTELAINVFMNFASGLERVQDKFGLLPRITSGFSVEDMPSNYLGALIATNMASLSEIKSICQALDPDESRRMFDEGVGPWSNTSHTPRLWVWQGHHPNTPMGVAATKNGRKCPCTNRDGRKAAAAQALFKKVSIPAHSDKYRVLVDLEEQPWDAFE
jgi:RHS repeat-associated protein